MNIRENIPISTLTTMRLGGNARYVITIETPDDIPQAYDFAREKNLPTYILGTGSNVIGRDSGFPGVILINKIRSIEILEQTNTALTLRGSSGEILDDFIAYGTQLGYSGMEAMSAIPGTLGAAPIQNVGAYGQDLSQVLVSVTAYDTQTAQITDIPATDTHLSYRRSIFNYGPNAGRYFIIAVTVRLAKTTLKPPFYTSLQAYIDTHQITDFSPQNIRRIVTEIRAAKLPDPAVTPSAGSFFKNVYLDNPTDIAKAQSQNIPIWDGGKIPSGWLIEHAGLKGKTFHGFRVSPQASLILINEHATTYADLAAARAEIQAVVYAKFGLKLEQEPVEITVESTTTTPDTAATSAESTTP